MFGPFKKERPIQGLTGMGGGAASTLVGGGVAPGISATGGDSIYTYTMPDGTMYKTHVFSSSGSFVVSDIGGLGAECEFVVVGGGGGGSNQHSGGGGGGGYRSSIAGESSGGPASTGTNVNNGTVWSNFVTAAPVPNSPTGTFDKPVANMFTGNLDNDVRMMTTGDGVLVTYNFGPTPGGGAGPITLDNGGKVTLYQQMSTPNPAVYYGGEGTITVDGAPYTSGATPGPGAYSGGGRVVHEWTFPTGGVLSQATMEGGPNGRTYASGIAVNGYLLIDGQTATPTNGIGGVREEALTVTAQTYPITVGAGGAGSATGPNGGSPRASYGGYSRIESPTAIVIQANGGGGSGNWSSPQALKIGNWGGSGGGGSSHAGGGSDTGGWGTISQGYPGGAGSPNNGAHIGGGGGGAGEAGEAGSGTSSSDSAGGDGGDGRATLAMGPTITAYGTPGPSPGRWFAGGGGSGYYNPTTPTGIGEGGAGGGGYGMQGPSSDDAPNCAANTGGGGSGAISFNALGGTGGSGIVILRYKINASQL